MRKEVLIRKIIEAAKKDKKNRKDPRFLDTIGFLVAKGFLKTNFKVHPLPNKRLRVEDAIWAGKNVEPRILEVLPAAVLRLNKHFDFNAEKHKDLVHIIEQLKKRQTTGEAFYGMPYEKIKRWADLPLQDGRVKTVGEKKIIKTFRLKPEAIERLKELAKKLGCTETEILEKRILSF